MSVEDEGAAYDLAIPRPALGSLTGVLAAGVDERCVGLERRSEACAPRAGSGRDRPRAEPLGGEIVLGRRRPELQLQLVEQSGLALRPRAVERPPELPEEIGVDPREIDLSPTLLRILDEKEVSEDQLVQLFEETARREAERCSLVCGHSSRRTPRGAPGRGGGAKGLAESS
jgi:hypothetical protein